MSRTESCGITLRAGRAATRSLDARGAFVLGGRGGPRVCRSPWPCRPRAAVLGRPARVAAVVRLPGAAPWRRTWWILPSQISGRSPLANAKPIAGRVRVRATETLRALAGRFAARPIDVVTAAGTDRFWFAQDFPHPAAQDGDVVGTLPGARAHAAPRLLAPPRERRRAGARAIAVHVAPRSAAHRLGRRARRPLRLLDVPVPGLLRYNGCRSLPVAGGPATDRAVRDDAPEDS